MFDHQSHTSPTLRGACFLAALVAITSQLSGCAKGVMSCDSDNGRAAIVAEVSNFLNEARCGEAIQTIDRFYDKEGCGTDSIRYARASAYACAANLNFFDVVDNLTQNSSNLTGNLFWRYLTQLFPSTANDGRVAAGEYATDALMALRKVGAVTPDIYKINAGTLHPGSLLVNDRQDNANVYLMLTSMAVIGALQNQYGAPNASYAPTQKIGATAGNANGWTTVTFGTQDSCSYAGAILNMIDTMGAISGQLGSLSTQIAATAAILIASMNAACEAGCTNTTTDATGCAIAAGQCTPCPIDLRYRNSCTFTTTDKASCAAAGIADWINHNPIGWN